MNTDDGTDRSGAACRSIPLLRLLFEGQQHTGGARSRKPIEKASGGVLLNKIFLDRES
jgi:hypothetical protein